ncbi:MAG: hypothetical protein PHF97_11490 [Bacteroidales bacterium]|nr:hypothetical protein [Bacteroidales bacterium]
MDKFASEIFIYFAKVIYFICMLRIFILVFFTLLSICGIGQDTLNLLDQSGKKNGYWQKHDSLGRLVYEGHFNHGIPEGRFQYYYPSGKIKTISVVSEKGNYASTHSFFPNGQKMASGIYRNEKKDSTWQFFSEIDGSLVSTEEYMAGIKSGSTQVFFPKGALAEMICWKDGIKNGTWEQYYSDSKIKLRGSFLKGEKSGSFKTYYLSGQLMMSGQYATGHQEGTWVYYDEKGQIVKKEIYNQGELLKTELP